MWALKNDTHKYKKLEEIMHVDGDWLALNTPGGMEGVSGQPETNTEPETIQKEVIW